MKWTQRIVSPNRAAEYNDRRAEVKPISVKQMLKGHFMVYVEPLDLGHGRHLGNPGERQAAEVPLKGRYGEEPATAG